jgi:quinohemoprotein ethanol dehydrogenase
MIRWTYANSARRFFPDAIAKLSSLERLAGAAILIGAGLAISGGIAIAQNADKGSAGHIKAVTSGVDANFIKANTPTSKDWPTVGLDYAETRFSKLNQINADNVKTLGLKWTYNLESVRGVEATPIVVDGIMYVSASWSVVHAIDARTGKRICPLQGQDLCRRI